MKTASKAGGSPAPQPGAPLPRADFLVFFVCLLAVLIFLFRVSFAPHQVLFSNDGPLGLTSAAYNRPPGNFAGIWSDLNWLGANAGRATVGITNVLHWLLGSLYFGKFFAPLTLVFLGMSAWFFFRQLGLGAVAALLGGLAAALTPDFFLVSCWGVGPQALAFGLNYLALGLVVSPQPIRPWIRYPLAGLAVGMGVMEAADIGAIFSLFTALFVVFHAWVESGRLATGAIRGVARVATLAGFAAFMAASAVSSLIGTQIKGVVGTQQDQRTKEERWDWATQWSAPKREAISILVPGVFGYRMDSPDGGAYWGFAGRDPSWDRFYAGGPLRAGDVVRITVADSPQLNAAQAVAENGTINLPAVGEVQAAGRMLTELETELTRLYAQRAPAKTVSVAMQPRGFIRYGGGGGYAGVLVLLVALWAVLQSFRKDRSPYTLTQKRFIWFWAALVPICLLLAFGRFAPFYQFFYALPYASTIRNPTKFIHVMNWALLVVFAFGLSGLGRLYLEAPAVAGRDLTTHLKSWWAKATGFDRKWVVGSALAVGVSLLGWVLYVSSRGSLVKYLQTVQFDEGAAEAIASFSFRQVGWFILLLSLALALMIAVLSGFFAGGRARVAVVLLGVFLVVDLARVGSRWVVSYNWREKYVETADNGVMQFLRLRPFEHRVAIYPFGLPARLGIVQQVYQFEWLQHLFQYYNIQSLDIIQMPRVPQELAAFEGALGFDNTSNTIHRVTRRWQLTNTRLLIGAAGSLGLLNSEVDPQQRFRLLLPFELYQTRAGGPILARTNAIGPFGLIEFSGALPRAKLYAHWQVSTNDEATLTMLASKEFDPEQTVLLATPLPSPGAATPTNAAAGTVDFVSYAPKHIVLRAKTSRRAILLLNDKYDPHWNVQVNGKPTTLLRCNYLMRGVELEPGEHTVEFRFQPPTGALYISLGAIALGLVMLGLWLAGRRAHDPDKVGSESGSAARPG